MNQININESMIKTFINTILIFIVITTLSAFGPQKSPKDPKKKPSAPSAVVSYKKDILPIFKRYCLPCHTEDQMNPSELYLDGYETLMHGGKHGSPIKPGKADSSFISMKLTPKPPFGDPMPFKRKTPVPEDTVKILRKWIDQGAKNN